MQNAFIKIKLGDISPCGSIRQQPEQNWYFQNHFLPFSGYSWAE